MHVHPARHLAITIEVPFARAYAFAAQPENFAAWAAGLADSLRRTREGWVASTPAGLARVHFSEPNPWGILDHRVEPEGQPGIDVPLRMMPNGDGTEIVFTLYRRPGMSVAAFERDAELVMADLRALKALLER